MVRVMVVCGPCDVSVVRVMEVRVMEVCGPCDGDLWSVSCVCGPCDVVALCFDVVCHCDVVC